MAYSTSIFVYTQRQIVVLLTGTSVRKYMPVYSKPLKLHRGVDNKIQFQFLSQQQKPIDITGKTITCRIMNSNGTAVVVTKALDLIYPATGIAELRLNAADIENVSAQKGYYSLVIPEDEFDYPVFVDDNAGARGDMYIVDSVLPSFVPSAVITIPTGQPFPNLSSNTLSNANTYYSSVINTEASPILTIQTKYDQYNGNVVIQGSCQPDSDWYPITTHVYSNTSNTYGYTLTGFHPFVRMEFTSNSGAVTNILAR